MLHLLLDCSSCPSTWVSVVEYVTRGCPGSLILDSEPDVAILEVVSKGEKTSILKTSYRFLGGRVFDNINYASCVA